jgi:hypothetical protein
VLASFADANDHLDGTKISFLNDDDASPEAKDADVYVLGRLSSVYPDHATLWTAVDPLVPPAEATPGLVRLAASLLMASYRYAKKYSEETQTPNPYSERLKARADEILNGLVGGTLTLYDEDYASSSQFFEADFWPNDTTVVVEDSGVGMHLGDPDRRFSIDRVL